MSSPGNLAMLTAYKAWANERLYDFLTELPPEELMAGRQIMFGSIIRTLNHVYAMDVVWKAHLEGEPHSYTTRNPEFCPPFPDLCEAQRQIDDWYIGYARNLPPENEGEPVDFTFIGGGAGRMSRGDILLHAVNHGTYHRGHVADMIYQIPAQPPATDLPVFLQDLSG